MGVVLAGRPKVQSHYGLLLVWWELFMGLNVVNCLIAFGCFCLVSDRRGDFLEQLEAYKPTSIKGEFQWLTSC